MISDSDRELAQLAMSDQRWLCHCCGWLNTGRQIVRGAYQVRGTAAAVEAANAVYKSNVGDKYRRFVRVR